VGVVTATGLWMSIRACVSPFVDYRAMIIAGLLAVLLILYPKITKKKLSPITLILISALLGVLIY
jgi:chromate transporter